MVKKMILLLSCGLCLPVLTFSQTNTNKKQTELSTTNIDYKQIGSPMPELLFWSYIDTSTTKSNIPSDKKKKKRSSVNVSALAKEMYELINAEDLGKEGNLLVMMFNPTCSHCEEMASLLENNVEWFKNSRLVMLATPVMKPYVPDFADRHHVLKYPVMKIGCDSSDFVQKTFLYQTLPQINIYNKERKLIKIYSGDVPADSLKKYLD